MKREFLASPFHSLQPRLGEGVFLVRFPRIRISRNHPAKLGQGAIFSRYGISLTLLSRKHDVEVAAGNIKQPKKLIKPIFIAVDLHLARLSDLL